MNTASVLSFVSLVGLSFSGCSPAASLSHGVMSPNSRAEALDSVEFHAPVHFAGADGRNVELPPGMYLVGSTHDGAMELESLDDRAEPIVVRALTARHEADIDAPVAVTFAGVPEEEDEHTVVLLLPNGETLESVGSYSGNLAPADNLPPLSGALVTTAGTQKLLQLRRPARSDGRLAQPDPALPSPPPARFVRVLITSLRCIESSDWGSGDEIVITGGVRLPSGRTTPLLFPAGRTSFDGIYNGDWVFKTSRPRTLWQGWLEHGQSVHLHIQVWEDDGGVGMPRAAERIAEQLADPEFIAAAMSAAAGTPALGELQVLNKVDTAIRMVVLKELVGGGDDDPVGSFLIGVENDAGKIKKRLGTLPGSRIKGHGSFSALSESKKTVRVLMNAEDPQKYHASIQVRDLDVADSGGDGTALEWKLRKRDDPIWLKPENITLRMQIGEYYAF